MVNVHKPNYKAIPGEVRGGRGWRAATRKKGSSDRNVLRNAAERTGVGAVNLALPHVRHH
jgi:hypothetical protein